MRISFFTQLIIILFIAPLYAQIQESKAPNWIKPKSYSESTQINLDEVTQGNFILMYNEQVHVPKQEGYIRMALKIIDNVGVQNASTIAVNFDPSYQALTFHDIHISREGEIIDKLHIGDFQLIRQESNAENFIYDGTMSAILNLTDVRAGDIIDYSYSIKGFNPIHDKFSRSIVLNNSEPTGPVSIDIISGNKLHHKIVNSTLEPNMTKINGLYHYSWSVENKDGIEFENNTPVWEILYKNLFISEYSAWDEVVDWGVKVFKTNSPLSTDLQNKIKAINAANSSEGDKILASLRFVQNDIRYLGIESGIGSYKPFPPSKVFNQRFGDCKDKSLLLVTMLNKMGIEAYPMLVNTSMQHVVTELLPSPKLFDHCVVKVIDSQGNNLWYDPTISNQGGLYKSTSFPDYRYGLVLKPGNDTFDEIFPYKDNLVEVFDEFELLDGNKGAFLKVKTIYHENDADGMRGYFKNNSISAIKKYFKDYYSGYYTQVTSLESPRFEDDSINNKFTVYESYKLDSIWNPLVEMKNYLAVGFTPYSIVDVMLVPSEQKRTTEYALYYPVAKRHHIKVKLPKAWNIDNNELSVSDESFYFTSDISYNNRFKELNLEYYFKSQANSVSVENFNDYYTNIHKVNNQISYYLYVPHSNLSKRGSLAGSDMMESIKSFVWIVAGVIMLLLILGILFVVRSNKKNRV